MSKYYIHKVVAKTSETDRKNSWYWAVLKKNYGNLQKAEKAVFESRKRADLFLGIGLKIRV